MEKDQLKEKVSSEIEDYLYGIKEPSTVMVEWVMKLVDRELSNWSKEKLQDFLADPIG